jgi:glycosyltransferase involved in cell wall biosynthesis
VTIARHEPQKDARTLLASLRELTFAWELEWLGDGRDIGRNRALADQMGIGHRIRFAGDVADVPARLAGADVFVLASWYEGLPRSIIEAMRGGLPVLASDVGGVSELVVDGVTGYTVPAGSVGAMSDALTDLHDDPARRRSMGETGRRRYEGWFDFSRMFDEYHALYASLAQRGPVS